MPNSIFRTTRSLHATVREVGLRDGLQSIQTIVSTAQKCAWIDAYMLGRMGFITGCDLEQLFSLRSSISTWLSNEKINASIWRAVVTNALNNGAYIDRVELNIVTNKAITA